MDVRRLEAKAAAVRLKILETVAAAEKGHIGGALSCTDVLVALYHGDILRADPSDRDWPERDRFILSKGHVGVALYVVLADLGYFDAAELNRLNRGGILGEHPDRGVPGVEIDSGSLGHGLGIGAGMALAAKLDDKSYRTVVLLGDGECHEGSVWEAAMFAAHHRLDNLVAIVDRNGQCVNDFTENINRLAPIGSKWEAFGWEVREIDGHSFDELQDALGDLHIRSADQPLAVIADTIKGKGVSFMERQLAWHHGGISGAKLEQARRELMESLRKCEDATT
jgi:transketolase